MHFWKHTNTHTHTFALTHILHPCIYDITNGFKFTWHVACVRAAKVDCNCHMYYGHTHTHLIYKLCTRTIHIFLVVFVYFYYFLTLVLCFIVKSRDNMLVHLTYELYAVQTHTHAFGLEFLSSSIAEQPKTIRFF